MKTRVLCAGCLVLLAAVSVCGQTKVSGTLKCDKPEPRYSIEVGDRPGHVMVLEKQTCTWAEPMSLGSDKSKDGQSVATLDSGCDGYASRWKRHTCEHYGERRQVDRHLSIYDATERWQIRGGAWNVVVHRWDREAQRT
jgi:hypothetical protein